MKGMTQFKFFDSITVISCAINYNNRHMMKHVYIYCILQLIRFVRLRNEHDFCASKLYKII